MTLILGIESSCDETAASVVRDGKEVLSSVVHTQIPIHAEYGGVVPELASRSHAERIYPVIEKTLLDAQVEKDDLDAIAVTQKPGLIGSLLVGVTAAKSIAYSWSKPLIGVHHITGHLYANTFESGEMNFPCIGLIISGGHTSIMYGKSSLEWETIGETIDDAAGEAFDKVAKILELSYPGGPAIEKAAKDGNDEAIAFPRSMLGKESLDFSFSGLKTSALYTCRGKDARSTSDNELLVDVADAAASFQKAVIDVLIKKVFRAINKYQAKQLYIGGGVICNKAIRKAFEEVCKDKGISVCYPSPQNCTDNATMIAGLAYQHYVKNDFMSFDAEAG